MTPPADHQRWTAARRELTVAACLVLTLTAAAWMLLGAATAGIVALICLALGLVTMRTLIDPHVEPPEQPDTYYDAPTQSFTGFWRTQFELDAGTKSLSAWDLNTRRRLQNLLAARLSERHGISLLAEPDAARRAFIGTSGSTGPGGRPPGSPRNADLWYWIDPERPTPPQASSRPGIPPRTLAALIQLLEQL
ncbi:MAG TPA: hypothetical protein VN695_13975 [Streptosporangiaceae bacterium]|nr:hypothetical protein [Streptosporangiaceae bacterium]